jgi:hypothetical protein
MTGGTMGVHPPASKVIWQFTLHTQPPTQTFASGMFTTLAQLEGIWFIRMVQAQGARWVSQTKALQQSLQGAATMQCGWTCPLTLAQQTGILW